MHGRVSKSEKMLILHIFLTKNGIFFNFHSAPGKKCLVVAVAEWLAKHSRGVNFAGGEIGTSRSGSLYRSVGVITYVGAPYDWHFMWVKFVKIHYEHPVRGLRPIVPVSLCYAMQQWKIDRTALLTSFQKQNIRSRWVAGSKTPAQCAQSCSKLKMVISRLLIKLISEGRYYIEFYYAF